MGFLNLNALNAHILVSPCDASPFPRSSFSILSSKRCLTGIILDEMNQLYLQGSSCSFWKPESFMIIILTDVTFVILVPIVHGKFVFCIYFCLLVKNVTFTFIFGLIFNWEWDWMDYYSLWSLCIHLLNCKMFYISFTLLSVFDLHYLCRAHPLFYCSNGP